MKKIVKVTKINNLDLINQTRIKHDQPRNRVVKSKKAYDRKKEGRKIIESNEPLHE